MSQTLALKIIFLISIIGVLFSGTVTYQEFFGGTAVSCSTPGPPGTVFGYPACVYGFFIYIVLAIISWSGLAAHHNHDKENKS